MPISNIPILSMLRTQMQWHQERQRVLAENVANADMPNFRPRDLTPLTAKPSSAPAATGGLTLARTDSGHLSGSTAGGSQFQSDRTGGYEVRPAGNAVNLEDEMIKVASNQMDYQTVTSLYSRSLGLIKTAIGRG
jgi:flagellar basal-body rod protein FlgB